jgi:phosphate transport system protein
MIEHTIKAFDADLRELNRMIADMGCDAAGQIIQAVDALLRGNRGSARNVVVNDAVLDFQQRAIEQKAVATIATRQPMAVDLREIVAALRIASELERIGDLAKNIGKRVVALNRNDMPRQYLRGVFQMTNLATSLLKDVLQSYKDRDSRRAMQVWESDERIDSMYTSLSRELLTSMSEDPGIVVCGIHLLFCAKNIERIGDHATNIAESVYYILEGRTPLGARPKIDSTDIGTSDIALSQ